MVRKILRILSFVLLIATLVAGLFSTVVLNISYTKMVREVDNSKRELRKLVRTNEDMQIQIARHHNFAQIEKQAREKLGMVTPTKVEFIVVDE